MHITILLISPSTQVRGRLRNSFLEPHPNLFVGSINSKQVKELILFLEENKCDGLVIAHTNKTPLGVRIKKIGDGQGRDVVEFDGIQLVKR